MTAEAHKLSWRVTTKMRDRARSLRRSSTDAERIVWAALRAHRLAGASFKRQAPIGPFIVDFVCRSAALIIEIDGGQHYEPEYLLRDARRDTFLKMQGYRVMRFNNHDVLSNRLGVLETIAASLQAAPSLTLSRKRGRGRTALGADT